MHSLSCITSWLPHNTLCYINSRFFCPWNNRTLHGSIRLLPRSLASLRGCSLAIKYVSITIIMTLKQQACFTLFTQFMFFFCWYERGLLNFVSERIKLVYRINNTRLAFQTSKTTIYRPHTPELKSISKFQLLFHWRNFEKYMIFYTLP